MVITVGWWAIPLILTIIIPIAVEWRWPYGGGMDFTPLFTLPFSAFCIAVVWLIYFIIF